MFSNFLKDTFKKWHYRFFSKPRLSILSTALSKFIPTLQDLTILDIGCGTGDVAHEIFLLKPHIQFSGIDVLERVNRDTEKWLNYQTYNGNNIPYPDKFFSASMLIDVLHHTDDQKILLAEAKRVTKDFILIKDHIYSSKLDFFLLKFMDWIGNRSYNVHLPYNYFSKGQWEILFENLNLNVEERFDHLKLYKAPISWVFTKKLHFIVKLKVPN